MKYLQSPNSTNAYGLYGEVIGPGHLVAIIEFESSADGAKLIRPIAAAPEMLKALEMVIEAATVYNEVSGRYTDELTPGQIAIRQAAKEAGMLPAAYVMKAVRAAVAEARGE